MNDAIMFSIYRAKCSHICPGTAWVTVIHLYFMSPHNE